MTNLPEPVNRRTETAPLEWKEFETLIAKLVMDIQVRKSVKRHRVLLGAALGAYCGLRGGDVLRLRWKNLVNQQSLLIQEQKTCKRRDIALNSKLQELVAFVYEALDNPDVEAFVMSNRNSRGTKAVSIQHYNTEIAQVLKDYGIATQNPSSHTWRKTFGKRVFELNNRNEEALIVLSQIFNHSSTAITRRYIGLQQQRIVDVYMSM